MSYHATSPPISLIRPTASEFPLPHVLNPFRNLTCAILNATSGVFQAITHGVGASGLVHRVAEATARGADDIADCAEEAAGKVAYCAVRWLVGEWGQGGRRGRWGSGGRRAEQGTVNDARERVDA